jgi:hypothetical protein
LASTSKFARTKSQASASCSPEDATAPITLPMMVFGSSSVSVSARVSRASAGSRALAAAE